MHREWAVGEEKYNLEENEIDHFEHLRSASNEQTLF